ncbi:hypothetical protein HYPSUDRAFT_203760 [Hypholoma sublateritium FD-334 SS-4]|uniref:Uncharacterized protein n=1 Tax=Hypholoma sublateritium (strain FD-334 SS-4) TaxID=945553 RepID=A0A0D2MAN9_HYPSF|nr:hypothetical protein HYPSUDRAFT_203760 [Hypholoma sublateritium FD-334 SS-4]
MHTPILQDLKRVAWRPPPSQVAPRTSNLHTPPIPPPPPRHPPAARTAGHRSVYDWKGEGTQPLAGKLSARPASVRYGTLTAHSSVASLLCICAKLAPPTIPPLISQTQSPSRAPPVPVHAADTPLRALRPPSTSERSMPRASRRPPDQRAPYHLQLSLTQTFARLGALSSSTAASSSRRRLRFPSRRRQHTPGDPEYIQRPSTPPTRSCSAFLPAFTFGTATKRIRTLSAPHNHPRARLAPPDTPHPLRKRTHAYPARAQRPLFRPTCRGTAFYPTFNLEAFNNAHTYARSASRRLSVCPRIGHSSSTPRPSAPLRLQFRAHGARSFCRMKPRRALTTQLDQAPVAAALSQTPTECAPNQRVPVHALLSPSHESSLPALGAHFGVAPMHEGCSNPSPTTLIFSFPPIRTHHARTRTDSAHTRAFRQDAYSRRMLVAADRSPQLSPLGLLFSRAISVDISFGLWDERSDVSANFLK